ncbi:hypothetical protein Q4Q52_22125 [Shewanella sp. SP1S2-4]|uniref:hypothetical protein n=1 Tax=Shewanella sp. SP1S2-4 TaxID=3063537 RepID=UPI00289087DA|nr:hypothetical protein [Shewanella sp. SP1S2-4]MDT3322424.1 hypothetical protein [Shewanella sp. SP1S2-4]
MGKWLFSYNQFGELATQTDARNLVTTFTYDKLGRQTKQTNTQTTRTWVYDTTVGNGKLYQASVTGHTQTHSYDTAGRMIQTITQMGGLNLTEKYVYDSQFGRLKAMAFPSGEHVAYRFNDNGYLIEDYQRFTDGSELSLRTVEAYSALGSINQQRFSNDSATVRYNNSSAMKRALHFRFVPVITAVVARSVFSILTMTTMLWAIWFGKKMPSLALQRIIPTMN